MIKIKVGIIIYFIIFQVTTNIHSQDYYKNLEIQMEITICDCMENEIENSLNKKLNSNLSELMPICIEQIINKFEDKLVFKEDIISEQDYNKFMTNVPNILSNKILNDCSKVCNYLSLQTNSNSLSTKCYSKLKKINLGFLDLESICNCNILKLVESECDNRILINEKREILIYCLDENQISIDKEVYQKAKARYIKFIEEESSFEDVNLGKYCDCYLDGILEIENLEEEIQFEIKNKSKKLNKLKKHCKGKAQVKTYDF